MMTIRAVIWALRGGIRGIYWSRGRGDYLAGVRWSVDVEGGTRFTEPSLARALRQAHAAQYNPNWLKR